MGIRLDLLCSAASLALFLGALVLCGRERHRPALLLILAGGLLLRATAGADRYLHEWDERYHAVVAKNLMGHPLTPTLYDDPALPYDYRDWSANHVWLHKQPLPLWAMALSMKLFGVGEIALRLPSILLSSLAVAMTAAIGTALFSPFVGTLAALLHAANGLIVQTTAGRVATDHIDLFHLVFVELAVLIAIPAARHGTKRLAAALGLAVGLAVLCKWLTALVVLPLWLILALGKRPPKTIAAELAIATVAALATFLPWQIYVLGAFPLEARWERGFDLWHLSASVEGHAADWTYHFRVLPHYGVLVALPVLWFAGRALRSWRDPRWTVPLAWFVIPFAFFTLARTKMVNYTMFAAPALFLMAAAFAAETAGRVAPRRRAWAAALILLAVAAPLPDLRETFLPDAPRQDKVEMTTALKNLGRKVTDPKAVFFDTPPIETMFYTSGTAYRDLPTVAQVGDLTARGWRVHVVDWGEVPEELRGDARVTVVAP